MKPRVLTRGLAGLIAYAAVSCCVAAAADQPTDSDRLRETLRGTMQQLNDVQSQLASLQAAQAAQADDRKALSDQVTVLTRRVAESQSSGEKEAEALKAKLSEEESNAARLQEALAQWKAAAERSAASARAAAAQRDKEMANAVTSERRAEDLAAKNAELFRIGSEILDRYEKFGLGSQFLAREPFVGRARAALENQVQDYEDKMAEQKDNP
jgi:hypothetical protein